MEYCIEARALKPSLRREIDLRSEQNQAAPAVAAAVEDEFVYESEAYGGGFVEDFLIEDLLDFQEKEDDEETEKESVSECTIELETDDNGNSTVSDEFLSFADDAAGLAVPQDDLADLEWVSRFVDDSLPEFPPLYPSRKDYSGVSSLSSAGAGSLPVQLKPVCIKPLIAAKPRTKRQRIGRVWSVSSTTASESSTITSSSSSSIISNPVQFGFSKPASKKQKTKPEPVQLGDSTGSQRRCSHCQVQKTPQWRAGPEGSKTLCNACGVRFKSGRLYPEYRPACSPTFRAHLHSSSHRKVLEMRKKKDVCSSGLSV